MPWRPSPKEAQQLLREAGVPAWVPDHCQCVACLAESWGHLALQQGHDVEIEAIQLGGVLHDVGRAWSQGIDHGHLGAQWLREKDLDENLCRIVEVHVGAGLWPEDVQGTSLEGVALVPTTLEEKLVAHADNLHSASKRLSWSELRAKYQAKRIPQAWARIEQLEEELQQILGSAPNLTPSA